MPEKGREGVVAGRKGKTEGTEGMKLERDGKTDRFEEERRGLNKKAFVVQEAVWELTKTHVRKRGGPQEVR